MPSEETERLIHDGAEHSAPSYSQPAYLAWLLRRRFYVCIFLLKFALTFYWTIFDLPLVRLVERAVCQEFYKGLASGPKWRDVQEDMCKLAPIQNKLAYVLGFRLSFYAIPGEVQRSRTITKRN
jgi:hypothetical protein